MLSIDTNLLLHAYDEDSPNHAAALAWLTPLHQNEEIAISELILAEFYRLLRNSSVLKEPLSADEAVEVIQTYRRHPRWRLIGFPLESRSLHDSLWQMAHRPDFAFRRLYDARAALTMTAQGVTDFATVNVKDYQGLGFRRVWNPLVAAAN
ncbi:MAG: PIN domain-containing protein [Proteobacteria bacterium]|nr:PIN domain-containing protein [Pseudomonadota bacterium]